VASAKKDTNDRNAQWKKEKGEKAQSFAAAVSLPFFYVAPALLYVHLRALPVSCYPPHNALGGAPPTLQCSSLRCSALKLRSFIKCARMLSSDNKPYCMIKLRPTPSSSGW
jgi:hypothetical protein